MKITALTFLVSLFFGHQALGSVESQSFEFKCGTSEVMTGELTMDYDSRSLDWSCVDFPGPLGRPLNAISVLYPEFTLKIGSDVYELDRSAIESDGYLRGNTVAIPQGAVTCADLETEFQVQGLSSLYRRYWQTGFGSRFLFPGINQQMKRARLLIHLEANGGPLFTLGKGNPGAYYNALYIDRKECSFVGQP